MKGVEDGGPRRPQELCEGLGGIEAALLSGPEHRREDLLTVGAARGAIAATAHLAGDHRGPQSVLGAPVRRVERGVEEEAEDGLEFGPQMGGEATGVGEPAGSRREQPVQPVDVVAARDREALVRDLTGVVAIARRKGRLQQRLHPWRKRMVRMVEHHRATATEQMREAGLMRGVFELAVRRPAVALQHAGVVGAEHPGRLRETAPVFNGVGRGVRRGKGPQPVRMAADFPAGFIGRDDRTAAHGGAERLVRGLRLPRRAMDGVHQAAARDGEPETVAEQVADAPEGEAALFVEDHRQGDGLWPELHGRGAQRIRRLQRMPSLDPAATPRAVAHRDPKLVDDGALHGQIFLVLRDDAAVTDGPTAVRAVCGQRCLMGDIDASRRWTMGLAPVGGARLAPRPLRILLRQPARKRGRLPIRPAARHVEFFFQPLVLAPQPVTLDLRAQEIFTELFDLPRLIIDDLPGVGRRRVLRAPRHAPVMPDSCAQYKQNPLGLGVSVVRDQWLSGPARC